MKMKLLRMSIAMLIIVAIALLPQISVFASLDSSNNKFEDIRSYDKWLPASLGIEIPNVNPAAIRDDRALSETEIQTVLRFGKTEKEAGMMKCSEFQEFIGSQKLTAQSRKSIAEVFPELTKEQISQMTYSDYENYSYAKTIAALTPSDEIMRELERRGITLDDFIYLRKFYDDDSSIIAEDDVVLRSTLKKYYYLKLDYACAVSNDIDYKNVAVPQDERVDIADYFA